MEEKYSKNEVVKYRSIVIMVFVSDPDTPGE